MSRKPFVSGTSIAVLNCKNIRNRSIYCNSVSSSSGNVDRVSKPEYPVVKSSDSATNISKSLKFTPTNSYSIDSSKSSFGVVNHRNIHSKRKLRKSVINSSFTNNANNHDVANKYVVSRDRSNVLTKPANYYISSLFLLLALLWLFLMTGIFINNNSFLESNSKYIFQEADFIHNPSFVFRTIICRLKFLTLLTILISLSHIIFLKTLYIFFSCRFYCLNLIFNIEYFLERSRFSELPLVFNSITSIDFYVMSPSGYLASTRFVHF